MSAKNKVGRYLRKGFRRPELTRVNTAFKRPPFRIEEQGWGEFDMHIVLTAIDKGGEHTLNHDLNFQGGPTGRYETKHPVVWFSASLLKRRRA